MYPHRDINTFVLYLIMGMFFIVCVYNVLKYTRYYEQVPSNTIRGFRKDLIYVWLIVAVWDVFASFRLVTNTGIGGMDAITYIKYFETCFYPNATGYHEHLDAGFKAIFKLFRAFTSNYHYLFIFLYGIIVASFVFFIKEFAPQKTNYSPYILLIYTFVCGFSSLRSSFGISIILFSLVLLHRKKTSWAILLALSSIFIHKACAIYVMAIPFYLFFKNKRFTTTHFLILLLIVSSVGTYLRDLFIEFAAENDLQGAYGSYATKSIDVSFWDSAYRTAIEQLLLLVLCFLGRNRFYRQLECSTPVEKSRLNMLWLLCMFDFILIPINFLIGNWRSPEFLSLVRVVMWGEMLWLFLHSYNRGVIWLTSLACASLFILRMWLSFERSAESGGLMPYIFEPFMNASV